MKMKKISVVVPVFNEESAISDTLNRLNLVMESLKLTYELIIVNDGSKDNTCQILANLKLNKLIVLNLPYNVGYGSALKKGISKAKYEYILITDADGTYPIESIPKLLGFIPKYDMVVGSRTGMTVKIPLVRKPAKWFLSKVANYITGEKIPDINSGLRVFRKSLAEEFWGLFPGRFSFTTTLTLACLTNSYFVKFIPINYFMRKGKSSIKATDFFNFLNLLMRLTLFFRPAKIFFPSVIIFFLLGFMKGLRDFLLTGQIGIFALILLIFSLQFFVLFLLAEMIRRK